MVNRQELEIQGYTMSPMWGGPKKKKYYTPDGREVWKVPSLREYAVKKDGKIIEEGTRDANYDQGLIDVLPEVLKVYCGGCDKWHDTDKEVAACIKSRQNLYKREEKKARKRLGLADTSLEQRVQDLTELVRQLLEEKNIGTMVQQSDANMETKARNKNKRGRGA